MAGNTAEIKTKLTADGSELTRALNQGIAKASDFRGQMLSMGKAIGAAFTGAAIIRSFQYFADGQIAAAKGFQQLEKDADAFSASLENLAEKLNIAGLGEGKGGVGRVLTDYRQAIRGLAVDLKNLQALENIGGPAGIMKSMEDSMEVMRSGKLQTVDEAKIQQMQEQLEDLGNAYERAQKKGEKLIRDHDKALREALKQFDFEEQVSGDIQSGNVAAIQAYKEAADEVAQRLREAFDVKPNPEILKDLKEAIGMSQQIGKTLEDIREKDFNARREAEKEREADKKDMAAKAFDWSMAMADADISARTPGQRPEAEWFGSALNRIGALGSVKGSSPEMQMSKDQLAALKKIAEYVAPIKNIVLGTFQAP